jgi:hypothetical protein
MFDFLLLSDDVLECQFGAQVGLGLEGSCGVAVVLRLAGSDSSRIAGGVPLGAVVVNAEPARHQQHEKGADADEEVVEAVHVHTFLAAS